MILIGTIEKEVLQSVADQYYELQQELERVHGKDANFEVQYNIIIIIPIPIVINPPLPGLV